MYFVVLGDIISFFALFMILALQINFTFYKWLPISSKDLTQTMCVCVLV